MSLAVHDPAYEAARQEFDRQKEIFELELLGHIGRLVREDFPTATVIEIESSDDPDVEEHEYPVRVLRVLAGDEVLCNTYDDEFDNQSIVDDRLTYLRSFTGEDYAGHCTLDLADEPED